jgi:predicted phosphodiesterase
VENHHQKKNWKRRIIIRIMLTFLVLSPLLLYFGISVYQYRYNSPVKMPWVSWFGDPAHQVYVSWETEANSTGHVTYGLSLEDQTEFISSPTFSQIHHVILSGLIPNRTYFYSVYADAKVHGTGQFRTAPEDQTTPIRWAMTSDTQQPKFHKGGFPRLVEALAGQNYSFVTLSGDLVDEGRYKWNYDDFFATAAPLFKNTPFVPVVGNHDRYSDPNSWFHPYFINHENRSLFYYSFNYSMVHFTICHFTYAYESEFSDAQMNWLVNDLANAQNQTFRVIMFHCPIQGQAFYGNNTRLLTRILPLLEEYNVQLCVTGHEHSVQRTQLGNVTHYVVGTGGGAFDPGLRPHPEAQFMSITPAYLDVQASATEMTIRVTAPEGTILDTHTIPAGGNS